MKLLGNCLSDQGENMSTEEIIRLIFSFLGGGLVVALGNWLYSYKIDIKRNKIESLRTQVEKLYGPLYFWVGQNEVCFDYCRKVNKAYNEEYCVPEFSKDELTQSRLGEETKLTIEIENEYIMRVNDNNDIIVNLIRENYAYIDLEDIEIFERFMLDYLRTKIEINEGKGGLKTPHRIYSNLEKSVGEISFMKPEFINRVKDRFNIKKAELKRLTNN